MSETQTGAGDEDTTAGWDEGAEPPVWHTQTQTWLSHPGSSVRLPPCLEASECLWS